MTDDEKRLAEFLRIYNQLNHADQADLQHTLTHYRQRRTWRFTVRQATRLILSVIALSLPLPFLWSAFTPMHIVAALGGSAALHMLLVTFFNPTRPILRTIAGIFPTGIILAILANGIFFILELLSVTFVAALLAWGFAITAQIVRNALRAAKTPAAWDLINTRQWLIAVVTMLSLLSTSTTITVSSEPASISIIISLAIAILLVLISVNEILIRALRQSQVAT